MKVALVYDRANKWGGAERVLLALHELFPEAPLYTAVYSPHKAGWARVFPTVVPSFLGSIPLLQERHELIPYLMPIAFESFNFDGYDVVISVTSEAAKGVITKPSTFHICYCFTPTRYLWSHYGDYFKSEFMKSVTKPIVSYLKAWDRAAAYRPNKMVAISNEVRDRIKRYYHRSSALIFPPVNIQDFKNQKSKVKTVSQKLKQQDYYLVVCRLVSYKKTDLAISAINELNKPLVIVGVGNEMGKLKKIARDTITFTGFVEENDLPSYYQNAKALLLPQEEDFGIVPVEAQAAGIPVIAYKKGGALDTVVDGKTGVFFEEQSKDSLIDAILKFEKMKFDKKQIVRNAERFSKERFKNEFGKLVEKHIRKRKANKF